MGRRKLAKFEWNKKMGSEVDIEMVEGGKLRADDIVIPVMGPTGAGKSSFINSLFDPKHPPVIVGHDLESCTVALKPVILSPSHFSTHLSGRRLVIVDTPGFDDTVKDDSEILARISKWLASSYSKDMKLGGVIYLHEISQPRMTGATRRNLTIFQKLCGQDAFKLIVLGTTKWNLLSKQEDGEARQQQLQNKFWKEMVAGGSRVIPIDEKNPWQVIGIILDNLNKSKRAPDTLLAIQDELVELKKIIPETEAGKQLKYTIDEVIKIQREKGIQEQELRRLVDEANKLKIPLSRRLAALKFW